jgi:hypothetical protein
MSDKPIVGETWWGNEVLEVRELSMEGWIVFKVPGRISEDDFIVKVINPDHPRGISVQHAHFALDLYGKLNNDQEAAREVFEGVIEIWQGKSPKPVLEKVDKAVDALPGYDLEYFLFTYNWILDQEDINYAAGGDRGEKKQAQIDALLESVGVEKAGGREGSQLAISLLCDIVTGEHPVEALRRADLIIRPR